jgi:hypothetical protein
MSFAAKAGKERLRFLGLREGNVVKHIFRCDEHSGVPAVTRNSRGIKEDNLNHKSKKRSLEIFIINNGP